MYVNIIAKIVLGIRKENNKRVKIGDKFILHSKNGLDYDIDVVNVNMNRPPNEVYAIDMWFNGQAVNDDVIFVGDEFIGMCEAVK